MNKLRNDFLWGGAVAAHQLEGGYRAGGKAWVSLMSWLSEASGIARRITGGSNRAAIPIMPIDFYHRYPEDIKLLPNWGWCFEHRLPGPVFFQRGWARAEWGKAWPLWSIIRWVFTLWHWASHYLSHFEMPYHLVTEYGGWRNRKLIDLFVRFAEVCFYALSKRKWSIGWPSMKSIIKQTIKKICAIYQFWSVLYGRRRPRKSHVPSSSLRARCQCKAVALGHAINPAFQIGSMIAMCPIYPYSCDPKDMMAATVAMQRRYWFSDVHARALSELYAQLFWKKTIWFRYHPEDKQLWQKVVLTILV